VSGHIGPGWFCGFLRGVLGALCGPGSVGGFVLLVRVLLWLGPVWCELWGWFYGFSWVLYFLVGLGFFRLGLDSVAGAFSL